MVEKAHIRNIKKCGYMLNVESRIDNTSQPYIYRGEDCTRQFVETLTEIKKGIFEKIYY